MEEGERVVNGFGGKDATVYLSVALAITAFSDTFPVDGTVCKPGGVCETTMGGSRWGPSQPRAEVRRGWRVRG